MGVGWGLSSLLIEAIQHWRIPFFVFLFDHSGGAFIHVVLCVLCWVYIFERLALGGDLCAYCLGTHIGLVQGTCCSSSPICVLLSVAATTALIDRRVSHTTNHQVLNDSNPFIMVMSFMYVLPLVSERLLVQPSVALGKGVAAAGAAAL